MISCIVVDDEPLAREAITAYIEKMPDLCIVAECENALEAIACLRKQQVDLIFLDIEMPEINGVTLLQMLKNGPSVIFTTAYRSYAVEAFDLDAIDFLLKPIPFDRFVQAINKYYERVNRAVTVVSESKKEAANYINVRADRKTHIIDIAKIEYVESLKDYVKIVCSNEWIVTHDSLSNLEEYLTQFGFVRIHRSYLVAISKIRSFDAESVFLDKTQLPISRTYKRMVLAVLGEQTT